MNKGVHTSKPCCGGELAIAGVAPADFGALDALAVKLISLDVARGVTGDLELTVEEIACLGCGHAACHFAIAYSPSAASHGVDHDHH